jgi:hypothetical protein
VLRIRADAASDHARMVALVEGLLREADREAAQAFVGAWRARGGTEDDSRAPPGSRLAAGGGRCMPSAERSAGSGGSTSVGRARCAPLARAGGACSRAVLRLPPLAARCAPWRLTFPA